jgi:poly-beta-1,6-N-acetyl-D-glucosamine synthase
VPGVRGLEDCRGIPLEPPTLTIRPDTAAITAKEAHVSVDLRLRAPLGRALLGRKAPNGRLQRDASAGPRADCSVGIMAYNEEANIADAIRTILGPSVGSGFITELIVVASGCEDGTTAIVAEISRDDPRVRLIEQERREGKASAINLFISAAKSSVLLMVSADVLMKDDTIDALLHHFDDPTVGMVGGRPTPVNSETTFLGHAVHLQWRLHDRIARESPKLGEVVAFRNVIPGIPLDTAVDEISIQSLITQLGYKLVYEPRAVVYNRGPTTVGDFVRQRRRIYAGHLLIRAQQGYSASTMSAWRVGRAFVASGSFATPRAALWSLGTAGLEAVARGLGHYDYTRRRPHQVWEVSATTKRHIAEGANARTQQSVLVFHIVNFHHHRLELGIHASRQLTRRMTDHIRRALGSDAKIWVQRSGTIVVLLPGDWDAAERTARQLVSRFDGTPISLNGHQTRVDVTLACAIIAFPQTGPPLATSVMEPVLAANPPALGGASPAASIAG